MFRESIYFLYYLIETKNIDKAAVKTDLAIKVHESIVNVKRGMRRLRSLASDGCEGSFEYEVGKTMVSNDIIKAEHLQSELED